MNTYIIRYKSGFTTIATAMTAKEATKEIPGFPKTDIESVWSIKGEHVVLPEADY